MEEQEHNTKGLESKMYLFHSNAALNEPFTTIVFHEFFFTIAKSVFFF